MLATLRGEAGAVAEVQESAEASVGWAVGPVVAGPVVTLAPQPFTDRQGGRYLSWLSLLVGARVGIEVPGIQPFVVRPSVVARAGGLPGLALGCQDPGGEEALACELGAEGQPVDVYGTAMAVLGGVELALLYRDRTHPGLGFGLKLSADMGAARLQRTSEARSEDGIVPFQVANPSLAASAIRATAVVSVPF